MKIVSVINYKGGVGKTTVTANLAAELAYRDYKILILDMDAQASLTFSLMTPDYWDTTIKEKHTIKSWFDCISQSEKVMPLAELVLRPEKINSYLKELQPKSEGCVDLISSHLGLINVDLELATLLGGVNLKQSKLNYLKVHGKLKGELEKIAKSNAYDFVLIDCPPNFNIVTKNAIIASDQILIPAKPDYLSTLGIDYLQRSVKELISEYNDYASIDNDSEVVDPDFLGVIFTMIQIRNQEPIRAQKQFISQTKRNKFDVPVFDEYFRENKTIFADAPQQGVPVVLNGYSNATHSDIVDEISDFVDEFLQRSEA